MKLFKKRFHILLPLIIFSLIISCDNNDEGISTIEGLDFVIATLDASGLKTGVLPTTLSGGEVLYTVDFGDPDSEEDVFQTSGPMVTYEYPIKLDENDQPETVNYTITLTASLAGTDNVIVSKQYEVTYTPPPTASQGGDITGIWQLAPEAGALGVGPAMGQVSWWANSSDDVTTRACLFNDWYEFKPDGTFVNTLGPDTWVEPWQGNDPEGCATPVFPHDGTATATYTYTPGSEFDTITLNGAGAFLGLAKVTNDGELTDPSSAPSSTTYLAKLSEDGNTMTVHINFGTGYWQFKFVRVIVGKWKLAPKAGALGVGPALNDVSWWSNSSEDVTTRDCLFDDEYIFNADGSFKNVLGTATWVEPWQGNDPEGCASPVFPHDGSSEDFTFNYTLGTEGSGTVKLNGKGAFLGLAKVTNSGELSSPSAAPDSVEYITQFSQDTEGNTILDLDINFGPGFWSFKLIKQ